MMILTCFLTATTVRYSKTHGNVENTRVNGKCKRPFINLLPSHTKGSGSNNFASIKVEEWLDRSL